MNIHFMECNFNQSGLMSEPESEFGLIGGPD